MKKTVGISLLASLVPLAMAQAVDSAEAVASYDSAIASAQVRDSADRRPELARCVALWASVRVERAGLRAGTHNKDDPGVRFVLLEIGNSGFPGYDYVRVDGLSLKSSFTSSETDISGSELGKLLAEMYSNAGIDLSGSADANVFDGNCYYLTVKTAEGKRAVAIYGAPKATPSGRLVQEMLKLARRERSP